MNTSKNRITGISFVLLIGFIIAQTLVGWCWLNNNADYTTSLQSSLLQSSAALVSKTETLMKTVIDCEKAQCVPSSPLLGLPISELRQQIADFEHLASIEKSKVSLVGNMVHPQLQVSIDKYLAKGDITTFQQSLLNSYVVLQAAHQNLINIVEADYYNAQQQLFYQALLIFALSTGMAIVLILMQVSRRKQVNKRNTHTHHDVEQLATQLENIDAKGIQARLNNLETTPTERRIFANLSSMYQEIEFQKRNADLYRQLYALIGYEIRGMTNTIQGGVRLMAQDAGENGAVMARDITLATNTLSDLADNYNRLISGGNKSQTGNVSFLPFMSELIVHLTAKTQQSQRTLECYLDDNLPEVIEGNSTSLFWVLFLQLSNAISAQNEKHILLRIRTEAAEDVEQTRLIFEILFLPTDNVDLARIQDTSWDPVEEKSGINDEWSKAILTKVSRFKSLWFQAPKIHLDDLPVQSFQQLHIAIDITPKSFYRVERSLENKHIMICTASPLQIDIMSRILTQYGATVEVIRTANDIFQSLPVIGNYDAIIITDTLKGIQLKSFCKTLHSRLKKSAKTKLFLAASESSTVQDTHAYVDRVFYTPLIPYEFIPNLSEALKETEESNTQTQSTFLIVEDDRVQQFLLKKLLSKQGYDSHTVSDGAKAVEYMKEHGADIVFMDCIMPGMGGLEATKLIRQREQEKDINQPATIIGATALTSATEHKSCIEAGMDYVISKPYKSDEIIKVIKKYMAIKKIC
ncbi:response regulator [Photobacterium frigidiphilum]|uniref:ATP-binding response regulator n=1 Tax=Photobacterium frigidiphilum TaxID=264736 RepID=UPI003D0998BE